MKRNSLLIAAAVLSGILYGLPGVSVVWKVIVPVITGVMVILLVWKSRGNSKAPLLFLCILVFGALFAGYLRARAVTEGYEREECTAFFEKYRASNPGEFDYTLYLKTLGVTGEEQRKQLKVRNREAESDLERKLNDFSDQCSALLDLFLEEKYSGVLKAMLLGDKTSMNEDTRQLYQSAGISHLLAVSGLHVGMIGGACIGIFSRIPIFGKRMGLVLSSAAVCLYCLLTGAAASSVRAASMLCIGFCAGLIGKRKDPVSSLCAAAVGLLLYQPYLLLQSGFLLSFTAMIGVYTGNYLNHACVSGTKYGKTYISTVTVSIVILPLIAYFYYRAPVFSVILNLIVIPLMTFLFAAGFSLLLLAGLSGSFFPVRFLSVLFGFLARLSASVCSVLLDLYEYLGRTALTPSLSQVTLGRPGHWKIALYYALLGSLVLILRKYCGRGKFYLPLLLTGVYLFAFPFLRVPESEEPYITVLDVDQGDCFHIHEGDNDIIIDCGSSGTERAGSRVLEPYLLSRGIDEIDALIISHADSDHTNGALYLLKESGSETVSRLLLPALSRLDEKYGSFFSLSKSVEVNVCHSGDQICIGTGKLTCIYCEESKTAIQETNRESSVWLYEYGDFKMLFTGDITEEEERKILTSPYVDRIRNLNVLKAAHHGSGTASCEEFLSWTNPDITVLSYGKNNRYGHPSEEAVDRIKSNRSMIFSTAQNGALRFEPGSAGFSVKTFF